MLKHIFSFSVVCILLLSCEKEYTINNFNNKIYILGHGGLGVGTSQYPLDSYEGVEKAISLGADGSEIDIQITKDSVLVCYHDNYLEEATDGVGEIYAQNWNDIKEAQYKESPYTVYKISSLEQVFQNSGGNGDFYTFDIKFKNPDQSEANRDIFQRALIRLVEKYHLEKRISIESPDPEFLKALKKKKSDLYLFIYNDFETALKTAVDAGLRGITVKSDQITAEKVSQAHSLGIWVATFSATRRNHDEIIKTNVDIIQTDDLEDLISRLR